MRSSRKGETLAELLYQEGVRNQQVLNAVAVTPRDLFLPDALHHKAYQNTTLPIGQGQTISQPYIVARMTELLRLAGVRDKVLEIGTGSGYRTDLGGHIQPDVGGPRHYRSSGVAAHQRPRT